MKIAYHTIFGLTMFCKENIGWILQNSYISAGACTIKLFTAVIYGFS